MWKIVEHIIPWKGGSKVENAFFSFSEPGFRAQNLTQKITARILKAHSHSHSMSGGSI